MQIRGYKSLVFFMQCLLFLTYGYTSKAQMPGGKAVKVSSQTQTMNGKKYYIHIVEQGQTVYAIARAYGLKEFEAVTKKDIHFLQVGDTVWLPCKGKSIQGAQAVTQAAQPAPAQAVADDEPMGPPAEIRPRVNPNSIVVSLMMPLHLSQSDKISTSKFDVEQRGKINYKSFEFIQFYEGLLIGLDKLSAKGCNVTLNVVDVEGSTDADVEKAFASHNVAQSDLLICLLQRQPFEKAAALARQHKLFIVNPISDRSEIVKGNPYVFKCMPSDEAKAKSIARSIHNEYAGAPIYVVHSNAKAEKPVLEMMRGILDQHKELQYTIVDWSASNKFINALKANSSAVVISLYDQGKDKNRVYVGNLLNKLSAFKTKTPSLYTFVDWSMTYSDVDFAQLQRLSYHTFYGEWDYGIAAHKEFVDNFRERYKTEPVNQYAGMANDIILYFVTGIQQKGTDFFKLPAIPNPHGMLFPITFSHNRADSGFENQSALIYRMQDYHLTPLK